MHAVSEDFWSKLKQCHLYQYCLCLYARMSWATLQAEVAAVWFDRINMSLLTVTSTAILKPTHCTVKFLYSVRFPCSITVLAFLLVCNLKEKNTFQNVRHWIRCGWVRGCTEGDVYVLYPTKRLVISKHVFLFILSQCAWLDSSWTWHTSVFIIANMWDTC